MRKVLVSLCLMLLIYPTISYAAKQKTCLDKINQELSLQVLEKESRIFQPEIIFLENDSEWFAKINRDYLTGVVAVFDFTKTVPIEGFKVPIYETREFGIIIGVSFTALLFFLLK